VSRASWPPDGKETFFHLPISLGARAQHFPRHIRIRSRHQTTVGCSCMRVQLHPGDFWIDDWGRINQPSLRTPPLRASVLHLVREFQIVHYKSFEGKTISALIWVPSNRKHNGSNPALVLPTMGRRAGLLESRRWRGECYFALAVRLVVKGTFTSRAVRICSAHIKGADGKNQRPFNIRCHRASS
jgi:hypothetical protein